jgi:disulfide bond formation protein DsbB
MLEINKCINLRALSVLGCVICIAVLAAAIHIENEYMLAPCPLCMLQRIVFGMLGAVFLLGALLPKIANMIHKIYCALIILVAGTGLGIATRQFWLQYFAPPQKLSCSAGLGHLIEMYPIFDALKIALTGSADCATVDFTILTISFAGWSVILFGLFVIIGIYIMFSQIGRGK